eukprot:TRINITY_DN9468_c0_g1_i1.p1 TRINITY_DN9468_c0_g1~~TRINITY_DN9468_c0_g1_i1.p1  ORF type:complete len:206 (+),score=39.10 TRINITY_DN9468_c0_g1_i1:308-925(+)
MRPTNHRNNHYLFVYDFNEKTVLKKSKNFLSCDLKFLQNKSNLDQVFVLDNNVLKMIEISSPNFDSEEGEIILENIDYMKSEDDATLSEDGNHLLTWRDGEDKAVLFKYYNLETKELIAEYSTDKFNENGYIKKCYLFKNYPSLLFFFTSGSPYILQICDVMTGNLIHKTPIIECNDLIDLGDYKMLVVGQKQACLHEIDPSILS